MIASLWRTIGIIAVVGLTAGTSRAQESPRPDGPLLGEIEFLTSASGEAQAAFETGVLALHSFWYPRAAEAFRRAQELDPGLAMAYWGEAMTYDHPLWGGPGGEVDSAAGREVFARLDARDREGEVRWTERERVWVDALRQLYEGTGDHIARRQAYADRMELLAEQEPDDHEALAFATLARMGAGYADGSFSWNEPADVVPLAARLEAAWQENPRHPGLIHYLIHLYDSPAMAPLGLRPARVYAEIAPASSHAIHMPSHIFRELGMWEDMEVSNERAWRASVAWQEATGRPISALDFHAYDWWFESRLMQGRLREARQMAADLESMAERARGEGQAWARIAGLASEQRTRLQRTATLAGLIEPIEPVPPGAVASLESGPRFLEFAYRGAAAGQEAVVEEAIERLRAFRQQSLLQSYTAHFDATEHALLAELALAGGNIARALTEGKEGYEIWRSGKEMLSSRPAEIYARVLVEAGQHQPAREIWAELAERHPRNPRYELGLARSAVALGDDASAARHYAQFLEIWRAADEDLPVLREARERAGS